MNKRELDEDNANDRNRGKYQILHNENPGRQGSRILRTSNSGGLFLMGVSLNDDDEWSYRFESLGGKIGAYGQGSPVPLMSQPTPFIYKSQPGDV